MRRFTVAFAFATMAMLAAACGSSSTETSTSDTAAATTEETSQTTEAMEEETTETTVAEAAEKEAATDSAEGAIPVSLTEFAITLDEASLVAGTLTFDVTSDGEFPHEFGIAKGDSYDSFAHTENGAIDEEALGADLLGKTAKLDVGQAETISFDLEPGNYVLFCNVNSGPNSHAQKGQVLSVTIG